MSEPVHIAAIDAGSNAVRLSVARAYSALDIEPLHTERYPLRLGESVFVRRIWQRARVRLEVISGSEESRLGREAVTAALGPEHPPRCIIDLGGGSLEVSILREHLVEHSAQLPAGTVRLMT